MTAPTPTRTGLARVRAITRRPATLVAFGWIALVITLVAFAGLLFPDGPLTQDLSAAYELPSAEHLLGTDALGRDILSRLLYGGRVTLTGAAIGTVVAIGLGVSLGLTAGYFHGWIDKSTSFVADLLMAVPLLLIVLLAFAIYPNNNVVSMAIVGLLTSAAIFRIVRGATLTVSGELYVTAAQASGLSHTALIWRHVAPRLTGLLFVQTSIVIALTLVVQVGLGFLSLDVAPPQPSWGAMVADASRSLFVTMWPIIPPTAFIVLTVLAFSVIGDLAQDRTHARSSVSMKRQRASRSTDASDEASGDMAENVLLSVRGLTVAVKAPDGTHTLLVENVSFDVGDQEIVGLVGESGAGKSVTARALLGINGDVTTTGVAYFDGADLIAMGESALRGIRGSGIAFIGQDPMASLDPLFTVESQLREAVRTHRRLSRRAATAAVQDLLKDVRIPDPVGVAKKYPFELSGGMAQRVCIALALAGDPRLLIADEPTTALDVTVQMEVLGLLQRLRRERGLAIILVTHDWGVVADMCDRAMTMYAGEIVESASVDDIFALPLHPYTAALRHADPHHLPVGARLASVPGSVPVPGEWPTGCRFAARCTLVTDACRQVHPTLSPVTDHHTSRCIRAGVLLEAQHTGEVHR